MGAFGSPHVIADKQLPYQLLSATDLDGDHDLDVLLAAEEAVFWYENIDGKGKFGSERVVAPQGAESVVVGDLDGDGDADVLLASADKIVWYENSDGKGAFSRQQAIDEGFWFTSVHVADVDGDGDADILSAAFDNCWWPCYSIRVVWYENDGSGTFRKGQLLLTTTGQGSASLRAADIDGDHDLDLLSANWGHDDAITWYENRLAGDTDDDGEVAVADFLTLADNFGRTDAVWEDGDFDGDGAVGFSDFLILSHNFGNSRQPPAAIIATAQPADNVRPEA